MNHLKVSDLEDHNDHAALYLVVEFLDWYRINARKTMADLKPPYSEFVEDYGIIGEVGEVIDLLKKVEFQFHELNVEKLTSELGDCFWYCATSNFLDNKNHLRLYLNKCAEAIADGIGESEEILQEFKTASDKNNRAHTRLSSIVDLCRSIVNAEETDDRFGYLTTLCLINGIDPFDAMRANVEKLRKRYGEKFSADKSVNRIDE